jgi:pilus assembly protein Flp/PilA
MKNFLISYIRNKSGVTAIEYGMIAALVAVAIIGVLSNDGLHLSSTFSSIAASL